MDHSSSILRATLLIQFLIFTPKSPYGVYWTEEIALMDQITGQKDNGAIVPGKCVYAQAVSD